jgi:hypothetical protein
LKLTLIPAQIPPRPLIISSFVALQFFIASMSSGFGNLNPEHRLTGYVNNFQGSLGFQPSQQI